MSDTEFESFVMNAGPDILRFCRIITNNKEQGDELYQDAMVLLLEKRVSLKAEQNSKSYALSVAVLLWKNKKKKYKFQFGKKQILQSKRLLYTSTLGKKNYEKCLIILNVNLHYLLGINV